jgi:hypothetical protein
MTILSSIEHLKDQLTQVDKHTYKFKSNDNIIKCEGDTYRFHRFDTITTHIEQTHSDKSLKDVYDNIISKLNYELEFASDRTELVNRLIEENSWIYSLVSTERMMKNQIKKKTSFLSENVAFDKLMERLSTYITHAKFKDLRDKVYYEALTHSLKESEKVNKRQRTENHESELLNLADQISSYHHKLIREQINGKEDKRVESTDDLVTRETGGDFVSSEEQMHRTKKLVRNYKTDSISDTYWDSMFSPVRKSLIPYYDYDMHDESLNKSILSKTFRKDSFEQLEKTVQNVGKITGFHLKNSENRAKFIENLTNEKGKKYVSQLRRLYTELKGDLELSKKILTVVVVPKRLEKTSTVIDINSDTHYTNEQGEETELSKNYIRMSDPNTYKGLILTYKELKDKYHDSHESDWWALIKTFEGLLEQTKFTEDEQFVLDMLFDNYTQTQIRENYGELNVGNMTTRRISNLINTTIPNKIRDSYLDSVEDWLYTEKIKGSYKTCNKCGETKLLNERHWHKEPKGVDGFKNSCKTCN